MFRMYLLVPSSQHLYCMDNLEHFDMPHFVICRVFLLYLQQQRARQSLTVALSPIITVHSINAGGQRPPASLSLLDAAGSRLWPQFLEAIVPVLQDGKEQASKSQRIWKMQKIWNDKNGHFFSMIAVSFSLMLPSSFTISNGLNEGKLSSSQKWFGSLSATH